MTLVDYDVDLEEGSLSSEEERIILPNMRRALLLALAAFFAAATAFAEPAKLGVKTSVEENSTSLKISVDGPGLPKGAIVTVKVTREFNTPTRHPPVPLKEVLLPFSEDGHAEALYPMGEDLAIPGTYKVRVSFEKVGQYPNVLQAIGDRFPEAAEVVLSDWMVSKAYMEAVLKEQAFLADAFIGVGDFLDKMNEMEALVAQDKAKGVAAWKAWRATAVPLLEKVIQHGRQARDKFYPESYEQFAEHYVFAGLFQMESRKFGAAQSGGGYHGTGTLKGQATSVHKDLEPYEDVFLKETVYYRLVVVNSLYNAVKDELQRQDKRADQAAWGRKRKIWNEILALWQSDLTPPAPPAAGQPEPPRVRAVLYREQLAALGTALGPWWDAEEAKRFDPKRPEGAEVEARKQAMLDAFKAVLALLNASQPGK